MSGLNEYQAVEEAREHALLLMAGHIPYAKLLGVVFERRGEEVTAHLPFRDVLVGNPLLPAIHGGATGAFLELTAHVQLGFGRLFDQLQGGAGIDDIKLPKVPKTIDITVDYLRSGRPRATFARAKVQKAGRRVSHVHVIAWQEELLRPIAMMRGNFLMPPE